MRVVRLVKFGNSLAVMGPGKGLVPPPEDLTWELRDKLGFEDRKKIPRVGWVTEWLALHNLDDQGVLYTAYGLYRVVEQIAQELGYGVEWSEIDRRAPRERRDQAERLKFHWDRLAELDPPLRPGQLQMLQLMEQNPCGRFELPTGYGKSAFVGVVAKLVPLAKIDVVTYSTEVLRNLYREIVEHIPQCGFVGDGQRRTARVTCWSVSSLHHNDHKADLVLGDESHQLASDTRARALAAYQFTRMYGFSANQQHRTDGRDLQHEAIFGPILLDISYQDAVAQGAISQIKVLWRTIRGPNPIEGMSNDIAIKRHGIWRFRERNAAIAADALSYPDDQVLVTVETVEHAAMLYQHLPDFRVVHAATDYGKLYGKLRNRGVIERCPPPMTKERLGKLRYAFEQGKLRKVIANTVWNHGVNFKQLGVLCRADGAGSAIVATQVPGRLSRLDDGKECGILRDYWDAYDEGRLRVSRRRRKVYRSYGWDEEYVTGGDYG